jgi:DNA-binding response OmpR family regulator
MHWRLASVLLSHPWLATVMVALSFAARIVSVAVALSGLLAVVWIVRGTKFGFFTFVQSLGVTLIFAAALVIGWERGRRRRAKADAAHYDRKLRAGPAGPWIESAERLGRVMIALGPDVPARLDERLQIPGELERLDNVLRERGPRALAEALNDDIATRPLSRPDRVAPGDAPKKVLLIDDEAPIRLLFRVNLEAEGLEVIEAADGPTGIEKASRESPDLILLDVMMPGLDGWRVAEQLRENPATRDIPFAFATPRKEHRDRLKGFELGAVDYIRLPCKPLELAPRVQELLARTHDELEALRRERIAEVKALMERDPDGPKAAAAMWPERSRPYAMEDEPEVPAVQMKPWERANAQVEFHLAIGVTPIWDRERGRLLVPGSTDAVLSSEETLALLDTDADLRREFIRHARMSGWSSRWLEGPLPESAVAPLHDDTPDVTVREHGWVASIAALLTALAAVAAPLIIVTDAVIDLVRDERYVLGLLALVGFPITFVVWPWTHGAFGIPLWPVLITGVVSLSIRKRIGR